MKIVVLDGYTENPGDLSWDGMKALGDLTVYDRTPSNEGTAEILHRAKGAHILITNKTPLNRATMLSLAPELRYIGVLATGYNVVDVACAREMGVPVCNIPTYGTTAVAQFTMALLLELCHHVGAHSRLARNGAWADCPDFCFWRYPLVELAGKTMGLIGYGRIGKAVASLAKAFGMRIIFYDTFAPADENAEKVPLETLFRQSDVISLHCPLFPENTGIINAGAIDKMKPGVLILNTARGPLINEADLAQALEEGKVGGAAVDVLSQEPPRKDNLLLSAPNCLVTPHIAWAPKERRQRLMNIAVENVRAFLDGKPQNVVNS